MEFEFRLDMRSAQPEDRVSMAGLEQCAIEARHARQGMPSWSLQLPVLVTYLTDVPADWALGLSAAKHGYPLVLVGHGRRWSSFTGRLPGLSRAVQIIDALAVGGKHAHILAVDGADTAVINSAASAMPAIRAAQAHGAAESTVLVNAECNSAPGCYISMYARDKLHQACLQVVRLCRVRLKCGLWVGLGRVRSGQVGSGWIRLGPVESGCIWLGPVESGCIWLGPVGSGWIWLGSVGSGWVGLGLGGLGISVLCIYSIAYAVCRNLPLAL